MEPPKDSPLIGLSNVIGTPHVAGSTREAQEEVGTLIAQQVRDYLAEGVLRNAVNLPSLSGEQYRRIKPWIEVAERLGAFLAQVAEARFERVEPGICRRACRTGHSRPPECRSCGFAECRA